MPIKQTHQRLIEMLDDSDRTVRRKACEALARADQAPPLDKVLTLLASDDRFEAWAARRILERMTVDEWRDRVLQPKNHRLLVQGGLALMIAQPNRENAVAAAGASQRGMSTFVSDRDFRGYPAVDRRWPLTRGEDLARRGARPEAAIGRRVSLGRSAR